RLALPPPPSCRSPNTRVFCAECWRSVDFCINQFGRFRLSFLSMTVRGVLCTQQRNS
ncbi:hypothetical protein GOODEAATRI_005215, partial [Goodea atripinnis]